MLSWQRSPFAALHAMHFTALGESVSSLHLIPTFVPSWRRKPALLFLHRLLGVPKQASTPLLLSLHDNSTLQPSRQEAPPQPLSSKARNPPRTQSNIFLAIVDPRC